MDTQTLPDQAQKPLSVLRTKLLEPRIFDPALAIGLTLLSWAQVLFARIAIMAVARGNASGNVPVGFQQGAIVLTLILLALCFLPLIARRSHPVIVLCITVSAQIGCSLWTRDPILTIIGPLVAIYTVGMKLSLRKVIYLTAATALLLISTTITLPYLTHTVRTTGGPGQPRSIIMQQGNSNGNNPNNRGPFAYMTTPNKGAYGAQGRGISGFAVNFFVVSRGNSFAEILQTIALAIAAAAFGYTLRTRREYVEEAERRAEEAERTREEVALRRIEEERLRIARELHDITAHSLSAVAVQAGAAEKMISKKPEMAAQAVEQIRTISKAALEELRSIVAVLRSPEDLEAPLVPEASMARLPELIDAMTSAHIVVAVSGTEQLVDIPLYVDMAAFRIIQESFTNTLRHANSPTKVTLDIERTQAAFSITITDDGKSGGEELAGSEHTQTSADNEGKSKHGIEGMRERAAALGGILTARMRPAAEGGGFCVIATLPLTVGATHA